MTDEEIIAIARERGRAQWGNPLPPTVVDLLHQYSRELRTTESAAAA